MHLSQRRLQLTGRAKNVRGEFMNRHHHAAISEERISCKGRRAQVERQKCSADSFAMTFLALLDAVREADGRLSDSAVRAARWNDRS